MTGNNSDKWIENILKSEPLEIEDQGFSEKVLHEIKAYQRRRLMILGPFIAAALAALVFFFPYEIFDAFSGTMIEGYETLAPKLTLVAAALTMGLFFVFTEKEV